VTIFKWTKIAAGLIGIALLTFSAVRVYDTQRGLPLEPWHTFVPHEMRAEKLQDADGKQYLAAEAKIFDDVRREVSQNLRQAIVCRPIDILTVIRSTRRILRQDFNRLICA
jgi:hypothetical protein